MYFNIRQESMIRWNTCRQKAPGVLWAGRNFGLFEDTFYFLVNSIQKTTMKYITFEKNHFNEPNQYNKLIFQLGTIRCNRYN